MIEKIILLADSEIERTAHEAVKEAIAVVGSEAVFEKSLREDWQNEAGKLSLLNERLQADAVRIKSKSNFWKTAFFIETAVLASIIGGFTLYAGLR